MLFLTPPLRLNDTLVAAIFHVFVDSFLIPLIGGLANLTGAVDRLTEALIEGPTVILTRIHTGTPTGTLTDTLTGIPTGTPTGVLTSALSTLTVEIVAPISSHDGITVVLPLVVLSTLLLIILL